MEYICTKCQYTGKPKKKKKGSTKLEFIGWMFFPLGLPYTFWRMFTKTNVCRHCDEPFIVSVNSPVGKKLVDAIEAELAEIPSVILRNNAPAPKIEEAKENTVEGTAEKQPVEPHQPERKPLEASEIQKDPNVW